MARYLITGVAGFVGKHFVDYLHKNEADCSIKGVDILPFVSMDVEYQTMDLNNKKGVFSLIQDYNPDYIVHLASISSVAQSWENPSKCFQNNTEIMLSILDAVKELKIKTRILSIGSSEEYGGYFENDKPLTENMDLKPINPYGIAKLAQEMLCQLYANSYGLDIVMTRSFNHIGQWQNERFFVPSIVKQLIEIKQGIKNELHVGNIDIKRDFTDVRDVVDAYYKILQKGEKGEVYNVCSGKAVSLREVINILADNVHVSPQIITDKAHIRSNEILSVIGDNSKLKTKLNWIPKFNLMQTLTEIIEKY